jgi:hypothetical protein
MTPVEWQVWGALVPQGEKGMSKSAKTFLGGGRGVGKYCYPNLNTPSKNLSS